MTQPPTAAESQFAMDTMFASQYLAYQTLSPGMKRLLDPLKAVHRGEGTYRVAGLDPADAPATLHPVVRTHPETSKRALYVNCVSTRHFEGMTVEESRPLLEYLYAHAAHYNFTFRHRWTVGDLLIWDNRCTQHYVIWDFGRQPRTMHRATVLGDRPV
jgi:taurine dioxygenase